MDTLDKGKHCSEQYCHQLDYLPTKCKACFKYFCTEHYKFEAHHCEEAKKFDYKIPVCELCENAIEFKRGKNLDLCLAEHMEKCQLSDKRKEKPKKICSYKNCKAKEVFRFECEKCHAIFCVKHRMPEIHLCNLQTESCSKQVRRREFNAMSSKSYGIGSF